MIVIAYKDGKDPALSGSEPPEIEAAAADRCESPLAETPATVGAEAAGEAPKKRARKKKE